MQIYSIFEPAAGPVRLDDPDSVIFLKQGFCWPALIAPLLWMLYHRMWLPALGYLGASAVIGALGQLLGSQEAPAALIGIGFGLIVAFEANDLRRWQLHRAGYRHVVTVAEKNLPLAEVRYFAHRPEAPPAQSIPPQAVFAPASERRGTMPGWGFMAPGQPR